MADQMTADEKVEDIDPGFSQGDPVEDAVKALVDDERFDVFVPFYTDMAKLAIVERLFPYRPEATWEDVPVRYMPKAVEIAVYLVNKRGAEGETQHTESGTSRAYESAGIPDSFFRGMAPFVGVPK